MAQQELQTFWRGKRRLVEKPNMGLITCMIFLGSKGSLYIYRAWEVYSYIYATRGTKS